ncbi:MAG: protein-disulfide reductase DsbD [Pseudomonadota bacterium]
MVLGLRIPTALILLLTVAFSIGSARALSLFGGQDELMDPNDAFEIGPVDADTNSVLLSITAAEGYFLYRDKFRFTSQTDGVVLGVPTIPPGKVKQDEFFGLVETHRGQVDISIPLLANTAGARRVELVVGNQGCADIGVCFPPQERTISVSLPAGAGSGGSGAPEGAPRAAVEPIPLSEQDALAARLQHNALLPTVALFFALGVLLAFTPCVFPMIPILSGIIAGQGESITTRRAFGLSSVYVLAMALTYAAVGVLVGLSGNNIQAVFQAPWVIVAFAALYVALSLSMFGLYELQLPSALQTRLTALSENQQRGTHAGVAVMGVLSALIVGPCITAPLVGILIYISSTGDALVGGLTLFALALGMGAPLLVIGTSAGQWLPKAGAWMNTVKAAFGVLLLAMAIWMIDRTVPPQVTLALAGVLAVCSGVYLGAFDAAERGWQKLAKGAGLVAALIGSLWLIGAATGTGRLTAPLAHFGASPAANAAHVDFAPVDSLDELHAALERAGTRQTILDFYADWCVSCKEMEAFTFSDPSVASRMREFQLLQADVTANNSEHQALLKSLGLFGPPAIVFFDERGDERQGTRVVGFQNAERFLAHLNRL